MKRTRLIYPFFAVIIFMMGFSFVYGDDHLVYEESRSFMGHHFPKTNRETWVTDNKICIEYGRSMSIVRLDLKKSWWVYPGLNAYLEAPSESRARDEEKPVYEIGWDYTPQYDWTVEDTNETQQINGRECKKIIARGDADYAEQTAEIWISKDSPINNQRYHQLYKVVNEEWEDILAAYPALKNFLVVKVKFTLIKSISPPITNEIKIVKAEVATPPQDVYEIPAGLEKVESLEELSRRQR